MSWKHNGARIIHPGRAWTDDDGYQHPANWLKIWDEASSTEKGLSWEDDPAIKSFDNRFYHGYEIDADGAETDELIPKSLADVTEKDSSGNDVVRIGLKNQYINAKKAEAGDLLSKTDWYVVRKEEKGTAIPSSVTTERDAIRTACADVETKITNAANMTAFIALFDLADDGGPSDMDCYFSITNP